MKVYIAWSIGLCFLIVPNYSKILDDSREDTHIGYVHIYRIMCKHDYGRAYVIFSPSNIHFNLFGISSYKHLSYSLYFKVILILLMNRRNLGLYVSPIYLIIATYDMKHIYYENIQIRFHYP